MIRSFLPKKTPKIAMFGPGLESGTLKIVPLIINNTDMLKTVGVAPGEFTGNNNFFDMSQYSFHNCFQIFLLSDHLRHHVNSWYITHHLCFVGVGAGFYLKIPSGQVFQLAILYSASSKVRKTRRKRLENNSLVELVSKDGEQVVELKPAVRACCCAMDAFIYVVDSTKGNRFGENEIHDKYMFNTIANIYSIYISSIFFMMFIDFTNSSCHSRTRRL